MWKIHAPANSVDVEELVVCVVEDVVDDNNVLDVVAIVVSEWMTCCVIITFLQLSNYYTNDLLK